MVNENIDDLVEQCNEKADFRENLISIVNSVKIVLNRAQVKRKLNQSVYEVFYARDNEQIQAVVENKNIDYYFLERNFKKAVADRVSEALLEKSNESRDEFNIYWNIFTSEEVLEKIYAVRMRIDKILEIVSKSRNEDESLRLYKSVHNLYAKLLVRADYESKIKREHQSVSHRIESFR